MKRVDPNAPDCTLCRIRPARRGSKHCQACDDGLLKRKKREAKEALKVIDITDLKRVNRLPPEEKRRHEEALRTPTVNRQSESDLEKALTAMRRWRKAPWLYVREVFHATPDLWQDEVLHAVAGVKLDGTPFPSNQPFDKIALKACKGPGKTCVEAWIAWWFLTCFVDPKVVATSVTAENLRDNLWTEMALWQAKSELLTERFEWKTERIERKETPETCFMSARTWPKDADKTKQANTLAGIHAKNTLLILDESGDIPEGVMVAGLAHHSTQGAEGPEVHITLQAGNPTCLDGSLGVACTRDRAQWWVKEITGDPKAPDRAPRMDVKWCQTQIDTWGEDFPWVLVNVFGKFPPVGYNKLLGPDHVQAAMQATTDRETWRDHARIMALDVARSTGRDRSVLCRRQGSVVFPFRVYRLEDSVELAGQVAFEFSRWPADMIVVDAVGVGGPVADHLRSLGLPVAMFYGGNPARDARFQDRRTETWFTGAQEIKGTKTEGPRLALPSGSVELTAELTAPVLHFTRKGQMKLESKEDLLKRGVNSPDLADALMMTFAEPATAAAKAQVAKSIRQLAQQQARIDYDPFEDEKEEQVWAE